VVGRTTGSCDATDGRYERGRELLGEVDGAIGPEIVESLGEPGRLLAQFAIGEVYDRPGLSLRDRELITVAMLAAMGAREPQLDVHLRGALNVCVTLDELNEVMIHVAPYAGFPAAINATRRLQHVEADA
jgi:4-carboxymuconolactone decarboxylase